jgi:hypothetical protein
MIPIPAFNILALGFKLMTHCHRLIIHKGLKLIQTPMDPLFKTLYTASMSLQAFLLISVVCPIYFTDLLSSPLTLSLFSGSEVIVYGTVFVTNASGIQDPSWECFIDNTTSFSLGLATFGNLENNWILCDGRQFQDGPHSLTVNVNVSNQQTFWVDQIQYVPSASVSLNQSLLRIDSNDSAIQYSPTDGWVQNDLDGLESSVGHGNAMFTRTTGATLTYQFFGS